MVAETAALRSSFYWKPIAYDHRWNIGDKLQRPQGATAERAVVQDIEVPIENTAAYVEWFLVKNVPIEPIWLCPLRVYVKTRHPASRLAALAALPSRAGPDVCEYRVLVGSAGDAGRPGFTNKLIERRVAKLDGHKSLYSGIILRP